MCFNKWNPYSGLTRWQKVRYFFSSKIGAMLDAFEKLWCVHDYRMYTIDSWEEELSYHADSDSTISLRTVVRDIPPYFVCKHCDKSVRAKVLKDQNGNE